MVFYILTATATRLAVPRTFLARLPRRGIHSARVITFGFPSAIGTFYLVEITFYKLVELLSALYTHVL